ncbi:MAG: hypothetical protein R3F11_01600 [Verrucomicrobiales bacterium]
MLGVNDPADADDDMPNGLANYPVLRSAKALHGKTTVTGMSDGVGGERFRLEFFVSPAADASGNGEGAAYLGAASVSCASTGEIFRRAARCGAGQVITATSTAQRAHRIARRHERVLPRHIGGRAGG